MMNYNGNKLDEGPVVMDYFPELTVEHTNEFNPHLSRLIEQALAERKVLEQKALEDKESAKKPLGVVATYMQTITGLINYLLYEL